MTVGKGGNETKQSNIIAADTEASVTALYCRLSQDDKQEGDSNSIFNQKRILKQYAVEHGFQNYLYFIDDGYSGTNFRRPGFEKMIAGVKDGSIRRIIVKDMSRLGRDYLQVGMYTEILFPDHDIHFIAINDAVDSDKGENELTPFRNVFNEWYARDTSKKIRAVKKAKGLAGEHMTSNVPYGYRKDPDNPKHWLIDEEAAEVVREIFQLCVEGNGPARIAKMLAERKILCPTHYMITKGMKPISHLPTSPYGWSSTVVVNILERRDYLGETVNFKTHIKSYKNRKKVNNPQEEWKIFRDTQEPIIDEETFSIVQKIRKGRRRPTRMGKMPILSGMLYCADCGSRMFLQRRVSDSIGQYNFVCGRYRQGPGNCTMHYIRYAVVEKIVLENLREVVSYVSSYEDEFTKMIMDEDYKEKHRDIEQKNRRLEEIQNRYRELDQLFQRVYEDNVHRKLSDERFMKLTKGYDVEQASLQEEETVLSAGLKEESRQAVNVERFLHIVRKYTEIPELTPEILHEFIDRIIVHEADKSSGKRLQEIEIIYNHIGSFDKSNITLWRGKAVQP
ncbi:DUF4368 domain-containing protein [Porcincola intestinalis]|uniref:DUF4368 domain-containing protein n=1 Tax=Porcincola intestinalis TaxID=2606632 RepID=UPI0012B3D9D3|nr:DUF4368 domain-containing protein [Porcincola intestinalis]